MSAAHFEVLLALGLLGTTHDGTAAVSLHRIHMTIGDCIVLLPRWHIRINGTYAIYTFGINATFNNTIVRLEEERIMPSAQMAVALALALLVAALRPAKVLGVFHFLSIAIAIFVALAIFIAIGGFGFGAHSHLARRGQQRWQNGWQDGRGRGLPCFFTRIDDAARLDEMRPAHEVAATALRLLVTALDGAFGAHLLARHGQFPDDFLRMVGVDLLLILDEMLAAHVVVSGSLGLFVKEW